MATKTPQKYLLKSPGPVTYIEGQGAMNYHLLSMSLKIQLKRIYLIISCKTPLAEHSPHGGIQSGIKLHKKLRITNTKPENAPLTLVSPLTCRCFKLLKTYPITGRCEGGGRRR